MKCPYCGFQEDRVLDSRPAQDGEAVRRRRECADCHRRFTTYEYVERTPLMVVKRDGSREPFSRQKLLDGILLALRKRPVARTEAEALVDCIEAGMAEDYRLEVSSAELGETVLAELRELDPVACVRFASVYRQFASPEQFVQELNTIRKGGECVRTGTQGPNRRPGRRVGI